MNPVVRRSLRVAGWALLVLAVAALFVLVYVVAVPVQVVGDGGGVTGCGSLLEPVVQSGVDDFVCDAVQAESAQWAAVVGPVCGALALAGVVALVAAGLRRRRAGRRVA